MSQAPGRMDAVTPTIDSSAVLWSTDDRAGKPLLVLLHGYGADERDLFGLVPYLPEGIAVAALPAPLTPPWPMPGRSWYDLDDLESRNADGITAAAEALLAWLDSDAAEASSTALLGFSQGAAVSLQALRLAPSRFPAIVALSGYVAHGDLPGDETLQADRPRVFWGRGTHDDVIPSALIDHTAQWLPHHATLSGGVYQGLTHSISDAEITDVRAFLEPWRDKAATA